MNDRIVLQQAKAMLAEIREAAGQGDPYALRLSQAYTACNPLVVLMPWPERKSDAPSH